MRTVALICARGGSKGIPNKNLRPLAGRPLIGWAIARAREVSRVSRVIVSTDAPAIAEVAREAGADVPFLRPAELATDSAPEWLSWRHALTFLRDTESFCPDALLVVPATAPLRQSSDLESCLDEFERGSVDVVVTVTDAHRSPYFNMVKDRGDGYVGLVISPPTAVVRRQDAPVVYDMTTVAFVARPGFVMTADRMFDGRVRSVHIPVERALDIDTPLDLRMAEWFMTRGDVEGAHAS